MTETQLRQGKRFDLWPITAMSRQCHDVKRLHGWRRLGALGKIAGEALIVLAVIALVVI
jgi:hypothetical protein